VVSVSGRFMIHDVADKSGSVAGSLIGSRVVANWDQSSPPVPTRPRPGRCHRSQIRVCRRQAASSRVQSYSAPFSGETRRKRARMRHWFSAVERMTGARQEGEFRPAFGGRSNRLLGARAAPGCMQKVPNTETRWQFTSSRENAKELT
jgi:hypothetical protein